MSYTTFEYSNLRTAKPKIKANEKTMVDISNTGKHKGDEFAQMYIRDKYSSVTRPVKKLKGFERITLNPGETKTVAIETTPEKLQFFNREMTRVVEPETFDVMVGGNSRAT